MSAFAAQACSALTIAGLLLACLYVGVVGQAKRSDPRDRRRRS